MAGLCRAPGCGKPATRYGHFCTTHKSRWRRHGDVGQVGITKEVLKPYTDLVRARIEKNAGNPIWTTCDDRWQAVVAHARGILGDADRGVPGGRNERTAAKAIVKLGTNIEPRCVVETVLAMYMLWDLEPRRFRSDGAFRRQLVRRVMRLSEVNVGEWYDHQTGRMKRAYRDFTPGSSDIIAGWLVETLGAVGLHLAKLHRTDIEEKLQQRADFHKALTDLA
jgi:hypothetical protein